VWPGPLPSSPQEMAALKPYLEGSSHKTLNRFNGGGEYGGNKSKTRRRQRQRQSKRNKLQRKNKYSLRRRTAKSKSK
jgi:hypothetical protein